MIQTRRKKTLLLTILLLSSALMQVLLLLLFLLQVLVLMLMPRCPLRGLAVWLNTALSQGTGGSSRRAEKCLTCVGDYAQQRTLSALASEGLDGALVLVAVTGTAVTACTLYPHCVLA